MRAARIVVMLVVSSAALAACVVSGGSDSASSVSAQASGALGVPAPAGAVPSKKIFLLRLIGLCAGVDDRLAKAGPNPAPALVAGELEGFVQQALSGKVPAQDQDRFLKLIAEMLDAAIKHRAVAQGPAPSASGTDSDPTAQANAALKAANAAAMAYGMPDLKDCPKYVDHSMSAWRAETDAPTTVQQVGSAVVNGAIWVVGGLTSGQATDTTMFYDPTLATWTPGPKLPTLLHHTMAVSYQNDLVVIGGFIPKGTRLTATTSDAVYRLRDGTRWEPMPVLHHARASGAAAVVDGKIVVVGGRDDHQLVTSTEVFDGTGWRDGAPLPVPGDHLAAVSDGKALYAVGGRALTADHNSGALQRYDPTTDRWTRLPDLLTPRGGLGAALVEGRIVAVGGEGISSVYATVESYDIATATWSTLTALPSPRHGLAVAAVGDQLFAIAGAAKPLHQDSTASVEELDLAPQVKEPSPGAAASPARTSTTAAAARSSIYTCPTDAQSATWA